VRASSPAATPSSRKSHRNRRLGRLFGCCVRGARTPPRGLILLGFWCSILLVKCFCGNIFARAFSYVRNLANTAEKAELTYEHDPSLFSIK
jgi:hypothetical protein